MHDLLTSDAVEDRYQKLVIDMTDWDLISYVKDCVQEIHGITVMVTNPERDKAVIRRLRKDYGDEYGALVIKWAVRAHDAKRPDGKIISFSCFAKSWRTWTDQLHAELQAAMLAPMRQAELEKSFTTVDDILNR